MANASFRVTAPESGPDPIRPARPAAVDAAADQQRRFFVGLFWRASLGLVLLAGALFAAAPWIVAGRAIACATLASAVTGAIASVVVTRLLHGRSLALRYGIAGAVAWLGGGVAIYLVEVPTAGFVIANAIVVALLGLLFYRAEDVARTRAVDEPGWAALELVGGPLRAIPRWLVAVVRRDD